MQLVSIDSASFGTLQITEPLEFSSGLNICIAPNQTGKSTMLQLLEWVLYGVPSRGRKRSQAEVERWRPWSGGPVQATVTLLPQHPAWPTKVRIAVNFEDFIPQVTDAATLEKLGHRGLFAVDKAGTWDIGKQLTGLGREAFRLSLLAPQEEMERVLHDTELRRLLTADLADLVEDPERASLDSALAELDRPLFSLGQLSKGPVQMGKLSREAQNHWQMSAGGLETQQERYRQMEGLLIQLETTEGELGERLVTLGQREAQLGQMDLVAAHWRFQQVDDLLTQAADWEQRIDTDQWLAEFPAGLQRDIDTWHADRRNLREQFAKAEEQSRQAEALKLRAPYVDKVQVEAEEDVVRLQERLNAVRNEYKTHEEKHQRTISQLKEIDAFLERNRQISDEVTDLAELSELSSAMNAASKDWHSADKLVREYGEGRDAKERVRLEELEKLIKPYRGECVKQIDDCISWGEKLAQSRTELEGKRERLQEVARGGGQMMIYGAVLTGVLGVLSLIFGGLVFQTSWVGWLIGAVLLALAVWLMLNGVKRSRGVTEARVELDKAITPELDEVARQEEMRDRRAERVRSEYDLSDSIWANLVSILPDYQRLRLSLEEYGQALRDRDGARDRRESAWVRVRELCPEAPVTADDSWLTARIRSLESLRDYTRRRMDEHSKLKDSENALEKSRKDEADIQRRLAVYLEPLGLGGKLKQDADAAVKQFMVMVNETRSYLELRKNAAELARLKILKRELTDKLTRLLAAIGLDGLAADDPDAALREFELRREEAQRYAQFADRLREAKEQLRHLNIEKADFQQRWESLAAETRQTLADAVRDEQGYDSLLAKRRSADDAVNDLRRELEQKRTQVERLRQSVARDEDVRDALEQAALQEFQTSERLIRVRRWQQALELLKVTLEDLQHDLASNLAPRLTDELQTVLLKAPVANVTQAGLNGHLELQLDVKGAPPGLITSELLARLSTGARRQLALALRIAVARALGEDQRIVLLLDEPLAELDDQRAVDCLRYLGNLADDHQLLMTTCHAEHQQWLVGQSGISPQVVKLG